MDMESAVKTTISIPEYYNRFIDKKVDLADTPKVCCPFHDESTPSFTYSAERQLWRCWGACKTGGDVISLHMKNRRLKNRQEAVISLATLLGISQKDVQYDFKKVRPKADVKLVELKAAYSKALRSARTIEDWVELDYVMSQFKPAPELTEDLIAFCNARQ